METIRAISTDNAKFLKRSQGTSDYTQRRWKFYQVWPRENLSEHSGAMTTA